MLLVSKAGGWLVHVRLTLLILLLPPVFQIGEENTLVESIE